MELLTAVIVGVITTIITTSITTIKNRMTTIIAASSNVTISMNHITANMLRVRPNNPDCQNPSLGRAGKGSVGYKRAFLHCWA